MKLTTPVLRHRLISFGLAALFVALVCAVSSSAAQAAWSQQQELEANDGTANSGYGQSVAVSGSLMVIGAPAVNGDTGAAYVLSDTSGSWQQVAELTPADGAPNHLFGQKVAVSGNTIAIAAPDSGAATLYVYSGSGSSWSLAAEMAVNATGPYTAIANSLTMSGNEIAWGSEGSCVVGNQTQTAYYGAVYIFNNANGGTWQQTQTLSGDQNAGAPGFGTCGDGFGGSVAMDGSQLAVGTGSENVGQSDTVGAVFTFTLSGGTWGGRTEVTSADGASYDSYGFSVALSGTTLAVGALGHGDGEVYAYSGAGGSWGQTGEFTNSDGGASDTFGWALAATGGTILATSPGHSNGATGNGSLYVFQYAGGVWQQVNELAPADEVRGQFGDAVAASGLQAVVGAQALSVGGNAGQGAAYVYSAPASDLQAQIALSGANGQSWAPTTSAVGQTLNVKVTLSNISSTTTISGISANPPVAFTPGDALQQMAGPTPAPPMTLGPGQSASYTISYLVLTPGVARLTVNATGTSGSGVPEAAQAITVAHLGQPIAVSVGFLQNGSAIPNNTIKLADADSGEIAQTVTVAVTLTNQSPIQQDNVSFNGNPSPSFHVPSALASVPVGVVPAPNPIPAIPTLAPNASVTRTFTATVSNNGVFDLNAQVVSGDDGADTTEVSSGAGTLTVNPTALLWVSIHPVTDITQLRPPGLPVLLAGTVENRSTTQDIDIDPLEPTIVGNAGGGGLADSGNPPLPDGVRIPLNGELAPASSTPVDTVVDTSAVPGTRATLTYTPSGNVVHDDGEEVPLTADEIGMSADSSPVELHFDQSVAPPSDVTKTSLVANFSESAFRGALGWVAADLHAGYDILSHPIQSAEHGLTGTAKIIVATAQTAAQAEQLMGMTYLLGAGFGLMSEQQRNQFAQQIIDDFNASNLKVAHQALENAVDPVLTAWETALQTGDYNKMARMAGSGLSTGVGTAADLLLTDIAFQKLGLLIRATGRTIGESALAHTISLGQGVKDAGLVGKLGKSLKGIAAGDDLLADGAKALVDTYGLTRPQVTKLIAFCKKNRIIVALRSRSARAAELISRGIATGKNLVVKLKNVDEIDVKFLGYSRADLNTVVWAKPISDEEFLANLHRYKGLDSQTYELAEARYAARKKEWANHKYHVLFDSWEAGGQIRLQFDGAGSGVGVLDKERTVFRRFELVQRPTESRYYKRLMVGVGPGKNARLAVVTQDVDTVAILGADSQILPRALAVKAYAYLEDALGIQHPDTIPWVKDGEVLFDAKTDLLKDHLVGGEPLAVFGPDGSANAAYFNPALTIFNTVTKGGYVMFDGAYNNPYAKAVTSILVSLAGLP